MKKAGFWPLKVEVVNASFPFRPPFGDKDNSGFQGRTNFQPQHQSDAPTGISSATEHFPDPSDPKKVVEHLDRLRALVLANNPTAGAPTQNKRKAQAPIHRVGEDFPTEIPKRLKREEVQIKQEDVSG